jgi:hypothetical protein
MKNRALKKIVLKNLLIGTIALTGSTSISIGKVLCNKIPNSFYKIKVNECDNIKYYCRGDIKYMLRNKHHIKSVLVNSDGKSCEKVNCIAEIIKDIKNPKLLWRFVQNQKKNGNHVVIGKLKLIAPEGNTISMGDKAPTKPPKHLVEQIPSQEIILPGRKGGIKVPIGDTDGTLHARMNKYYFESLKNSQGWVYIGQSGDSKNNFPVKIPANIKRGEYRVKGIITAQGTYKSDNFIFIAEDTMNIKITD